MNAPRTQFSVKEEGHKSMTNGQPRESGMVCLLLALVALTALASELPAQSSSSGLVLQKPENVTVWRDFDADEGSFTVWIKWSDVADSLAGFIHQPDTTDWQVTTPPDSLSNPRTRGRYTGEIDRTVDCRATAAGTVGGPGAVTITYEIVKEGQWNGVLDIGDGYTPGTWFPLIFRNQETGQTLDLGIELNFPPGLVDFQGQFDIGCEDFEGYHVWRGIAADGSDLEILGEISKEEAFLGDQPGGSEMDSAYLYLVLPALRDTGMFRFPGSFECLGSTIHLDLEDNEMFWYDCGAFNGFTYYYLVTTYDRGYSVASGRQGLFKVDRCQPEEGISLPDSCRRELKPIDISVDPQEEMRRVYAVPNPFRTGGSRLTTENYHNFVPDEKVCFVNVPESCTIKIFTVSGDLVWEHQHNGPTGNIEWDTRNRGGTEVGSGVYVYRVEGANGGDVYGRLIIIR